MNFEYLFLVGTNAAQNGLAVMYGKLGVAAAIIFMLLIIKFSSNHKTIHHG